MIHFEPPALMLMMYQPSTAQRKLIIIERKYCSVGLTVNSNTENEIDIVAVGKQELS